MTRQSTDVHSFRGTWNGLAAFVVAVALVSAAGCGGNGDPRQNNLSGNVTFGGKPIPAGSIVFEPDASKGNTGPQGLADIRDGKYDTSATGKGTVGGPYIVRITGFDRVEENEYEPATPLFAEYKIEADLPEETGKMDFEVPADAPKKAGKSGGSVTDF